MVNLPPFFFFSGVKYKFGLNYFFSFYEKKVHIEFPPYSGKKIFLAFSLIFFLKEIRQTVNSRQK